MKRRGISVAVIMALTVTLLVGGCARQKPPPEALQLSAQSLKERQLQTRRFETTNEASILSASAAVLQDLGFNLDESETDLGVIVGSKKRDATSAGQVVGAVVLALFTGAVVPVDDSQTIRVSLVTTPFGRDSIAVRITLQRVIINTAGKVSKAEPIVDQKVYQEFFEKLSQSIFLEAYQI